MLTLGRTYSEILEKNPESLSHLSQDSQNVDSVSDSTVTPPKNNGVTPLSQEGKSLSHQSDPEKSDRNSSTSNPTTVTGNSENVTGNSLVVSQPEPSLCKECDRCDRCDSKKSTPQKMLELVMTDNALWKQWESDHGEFPHRASNQQAAKRARCQRLVYELMQCSVKEDLANLLRNPEFKNQYRWILTIARQYGYSEYAHYEACKKRSQPSLFD